MSQVTMRLPAHLEIVGDEYGVMLFGRGPYDMYIRNKNTKQIFRVVIPMPNPNQENLPEFFRRMFKKVLKEQLNEDVEYR